MQCPRVDREHRAAEAVIPGKPIAKLEGKAQDPLSNRGTWEHVVYEMCCALGHPAAAAARTEASALARKRNQPIGAAARRTPAFDSPLLTRHEATGYCRVGLRTFDRRVAPHVRALKARYGRELPLSARARAALDSACPDQGAIFPKFDGRHTLRKAAVAAGLEPERANEVSAYDLRHSLATELTERSGNLVGVGYLLGHKHVTTTNHYVHARRKAAESVLSGHRLGHQGVGRPNEESSGVAQLPGIKGCGREDSNLHGCYPTRSLV